MATLRLRRAQYLGYGIGATGSSGFGTVPGLVLAVFLTDVVGVAAGIAALVVLLPKAWGVVFLPIVGNLSDRVTARTGRRSGFLVIGAVGLLISFPLMFGVPAGASPNTAAVWVLVGFLIAATAFGFFQVPYVALSAEITDNAQERTTLMTWRVGLQFLGILSFGIGAPLIATSAANDARGFLAMGVVVGAAICVAMLACWATVRRMPRYAGEPTSGDINLLHQLRLTWQSRAFRILLSAFVLQALGTGAVLAALPYFAGQILGLASFGVVYGLLILPAALAMPLWGLLARRLGKRRGYLTAIGLFLAGMLGTLTGGYTPVAITLAFMLLVSVGYSGMQLFPLALLPDVIDDDARVSGQQRAGAFTGIWTAGETVSFAIGPALVLLILAISGYASTTSAVVVEQSGTAITGIRVATTLLPLALVALSVPLVLRWSLTGEGPREHAGPATVDG